MKKLKQFFEKTKIEVITESKSIPSKKVIGFRGVRENLGATTLLTHCAISFAERGMSVCVVDFDFNTPNPMLSGAKAVSISTKWNNVSENINSILNKTIISPDISYVGANLTCSILDYMPLKVDKSYLAQKQDVVSTMFRELRPKFDIILVDIPSDIRQPEVFYSLLYCDEVYTLTKYDKQCLNKLLRDLAVCDNVLEEKKLIRLVHVEDFFSDMNDYKTVNTRLKCVAKIAVSKNIAEKSMMLMISNAEKVKDIQDYKQYLYYQGVLSIIRDITGEEVKDD